MNSRVIDVSQFIMVGVAQLVELRFVVPAVGGSSPLVHPIFLFFSFLSNKSFRIHQVARKS